jgi:hypothetical protein
MNDLTSLERIKPNLPKFVIDGLFAPQHAAATPSSEKAPRRKQVEQAPTSACDRGDVTTPARQCSRKGTRVTCEKKRSTCSSVKRQPKSSGMASKAQRTFSANRKAKPTAKSFDLGTNEPADAQSSSDNPDEESGPEGDDGGDKGIAREACATSAAVACVPEDDYTFHFEYPAVEVKASLQNKGDSGDGLFAKRDLLLYEAFPIIGAGITDDECSMLKESGMDTHLFATAAGVIDGHPRRSPYRRVANRGARIAFKLNNPSTTKPNCVRLGMWVVVAVNKIAAGKELLIAYAPGSSETYKRSRYTKSPQYFPSMTSCCVVDAEDDCESECVY